MQHVGAMCTRAQTGNSTSAQTTIKARRMWPLCPVRDSERMVSFLLPNANFACALQDSASASLTWAALEPLFRFCVLSL